MFSVYYSVCPRDVLRMFSDDSGDVSDVLRMLCDVLEMLSSWTCKDIGRLGSAAIVQC